MTPVRFHSVPGWSWAQHQVMNPRPVHAAAVPARGEGAEEGSFWICYQVYDIGTHHRRPRLGPISREAIKCIECDGGSSNKSLIFQNTYCE